MTACFPRPGSGASGLPERRRRSGCVLRPRPLRVFGPRSRRKPELAGRASFNAVAGADFRYRSLPWGRRIRSVSEAGGALRDRPSSLQSGQITVFTAFDQRRPQIRWRKPTIIEASPVWLAFAAGQVRLAPVPVCTGSSIATFPGRSAFLLHVRELFAGGRLSLSSNQGAPPYDPCRSSIPPDPLFLETFAPSSGRSPQTSGAANRASG